MKNKPVLTIVLAAGTFALLAGCKTTDDSPPHKAGSYTAARHRPHTGSNIPQPYSIDNANDTMSSSDLERAGRISDSSLAARGGGGGR